MLTLFVLLSAIAFSSIQTDETTTTKATPIAIKANSLIFPPWRWPCWWWDRPVLQDTAGDVAAPKSAASTALLRWPCWWWPDHHFKLIMTSLHSFFLLATAFALSTEARMLPIPYPITYPPWHPWNCWWDYGVGPIMFKRDASPTASSTITVDSTLYRPWDWPCWGGIIDPVIIDDPLPFVAQVATPPSPIAVPAPAPAPLPAPPVAAKSAPAVKAPAS